MERRQIILGGTSLLFFGGAGCLNLGDETEESESTSETDSDDDGIPTEEDGTNNDTASTDSADTTDTADDEQTGQVANNLNVISETGTVGSDGETVIELQLTVQPAAGSDSIDLSEIELDLDTTDWEGTLTQSASGETPPEEVTAAPARDEFGIEVVTASSTDDVVATDNADRYSLVIDASGDGTVQPLSAGTSVDVTVSLPGGTRREHVLTVPDSLAEVSPGDAVSL